MGLALCGCAACAWANPAESLQDNEAARVATVFADRVRAYGALSAAERRDSRQGHIFTPTVTERFQKIGYGDDKPVAPNNARVGRAQNRRVVVRVMS